MEDKNNPDPIILPVNVPFGVRMRHIVSETWRFFFTITVPLLLLPIFLWKPDKKYEKAPHAAYLTILMAIFWTSECIPLPITSLIPIVLVPLFGITGSEEITGQYFNYVVQFLFAGCLVALAFEYSNLHCRIAFFVMKSMGSKASVLLFGMMITCMTLSCWMNNTSTTAMMVPVIFPIMDQYKAGMIPKETAAELAEKYGDPREETPNNVAVESKRTLNAMELGRTNKVEPMETANSPEGQAAPNDTSATETDNVEKESTVVKCTNKAASVEYWENYIQSKKKYVRNLEIMFLIGVAFSSNIGGTGVVTGTSTNLIAVSQLRSYKQDLTGKDDHIADHKKCLSAEPQHAYWDLDFLRWIMLNFFGMLVNTLVSWVFLSIFYQGFPSQIKSFWRTCIMRKKTDVLAAKEAAEIREISKKIRTTIKNKYDALGRTSFHELMVLFLFVLLACLWVFRNPQFARGKKVKFDRKLDNETLQLAHFECWKAKGNGTSKLYSTWGWARFFGDECSENFVLDYVPTLFVCFLLFVLPKEVKYYKNVFRGGIAQGVDDPLLPMSFVADNAPWAPLFLLGGGFAISKAISDSNLSKFMSDTLNGQPWLKEMSVGALLSASLVFVAILTTIASNTATAIITCPILIELARVKSVPPLYMVLPPIIAASYAFCLPISTPPNAIVYDKANMKQTDMFVPGFFLTIICNIVLYFITITYTHWALDVGSYKGYCDIK